MEEVRQHAATFRKPSVRVMSLSYDMYIHVQFD